MEPHEMMDELVALVEAGGMDVRVSTTRESEQTGFSGHSGCCVIRGQVMVILSLADPIEERVHVLLKALLEHSREILETRFISPAIRERLNAISAD